VGEMEIEKALASWSLVCFSLPVPLWGPGFHTAGPDWQCAIWFVNASAELEACRNNPVDHALVCFQAAWVGKTE
jgi:hypothetical protein